MSKKERVESASNLVVWMMACSILLYLLPHVFGSGWGGFGRWVLFTLAVRLVLTSTRVTVRKDGEDD